jgi:hypothetical protein
MKSPTRRLGPFLLGACALPLFATAQTTPAVPSTPQTPTGPVGAAGAAAQPTRFSDLTKAPPSVAAPAQAVTSLAESLRQGIVNPAGTTTPLSVAVAQANTAIIRDGQAVRADALAGRQRTLTRLRLAQTEADRQKLIVDLRLQSGERLDDQRETARLVRDRLRQVRDDATLTRPVSPTP